MASNFQIQNMHLLAMQVSEIPMFNFISRSRISPQFRVSLPITRHHCLSLSVYSSPSPLSDSEQHPTEEHSFAVSYVINTFGWTPEFAISKLKGMKFETPEKPDRILAFFKKHGFTKTQILHLVKKYPPLLLCDPETTLLPKFDFLSSLGLSRTEVTGVVTKEPRILHRSLEKRIVPAFNHICDLVKSDVEAVKMVKRYPAILNNYLEVENIQILREIGVPEENIAASMIYQRNAYTPSPDIYRKLVEEVKEMGFDPCSLKFLSALRTIRSMSQSTREDKLQVLRKYGWSDREFLLAFMNCPKFISSSKDKIEKVMDFLVNRMGIEATTIANWPNIISMNLEKRIVPRCLVYQYVLEKGLRKRKLSIYTFCCFSENQFVIRVIKPYVNEAPELWDLCKELFGLGNDLQI